MVDTTEPVKDVLDGSPGSVYASAAMDQDGLWKARERIPNLRKMTRGERGMLMIAGGYVHHVKAGVAVVTNQTAGHGCVQAELILRQQTNDGLGAKRPRVF